MATKKKTTKFDGKLLAADILAKREKNDLSFRVAQKQAGLNSDHLFRMEAQKAIPRADSLAKVLDWLELPANRYFHL
jgi:lambda repressor-like predicted transcriptional regulator